MRARFGEHVAILHSALTDAERRDERERIASGEARIVVGARSAIFAPVRGLGLIVVDEEHDPSYKQDSDPRYDARTVAAKRAALEGAVAVFGSATPRPESWASLERLELGGRLGADLPPVRVVDLRREAGYPLSAPLLAELRKVAEHRGKAILLLNRRGVAPALHCRACGTTIRCPNCDVALVLHGDRALRCHHCGYAEPAPATCPACGSPELARLGAGTQRLERELAREFPELELIRLDADTTAKPELTMAALQRFAETDRAVLLGTQMVAKGHHFAGVELAAVIDADTALAMPDFRAEERTFQLITQLAGRSGDAPGRVLVQTFQPDARPIAYAARHDVTRFLDEELERRRELGYPPFGHLVSIVVSGPELAAALRALEELRDGMRDVDCSARRRSCACAAATGPSSIAKTDRPRAVATQAARLLAAPRPRDASGRAGGRRRRRSAVLLGRHSGVHRQTVSVKRTPAEEILGEWGIRDVTPPSQRRARGLGRARPEPLTGTAAPAAHPQLPRRGRQLPRLARRAAAVHAAAPDDRGRDRSSPRAARRGLRRAPRRPGRLAADRRALELQRGERPDRAPQPLVPARGAARDGSAVARLRPGGRAAVSPRAARRRLVLGSPTLSRPWQTIRHVGHDTPTTTTITITSTTTSTTTPKSEDRDAGARQLRRQALAQIRQYPDVALRMKAREVTEFDDDLPAGSSSG